MYPSSGRWIRSRWDRERLRVGRAHVERLDQRGIAGLAGGEAASGEAAHPGGVGESERRGAGEAGRQGIDRRHDLADEDDSPCFTGDRERCGGAGLAAGRGEGVYHTVNERVRGEEHLVFLGVDGGQDHVGGRRRAFTERGGGHGLERDDADERDSEAEGDPLGGGDADAHAGERAWPLVAREGSEGAAVEARGGERGVDRLENALGVALKVDVAAAAEDVIAFEDDGAAPRGRGGEGEDLHRGTLRRAGCRAQAVTSDSGIMRRTLWPTWGAMRRVLVASAGSLAFHGGIVAIAVLVATLKREPQGATMAAPVHAVDVWSGVTAAIGGERLVDVNVDAIGGQVGLAGAPAKAADATPPAAPPPPPRAALAPTPAAEKPALPDDPTTTEPPPKPRGKKATSVVTDPAVGSATGDPGDPDTKPAPPASPRATKRKVGGGAGGENGDGAKLGPFGAEGPIAVRSLGRGFARSIAAACVGDGGWGKLPVGDAGSIEVAITVDESGRITGFRSLDRDPPKQMLALVKRTIALIDSGTFELKGSVGAGVEILRIQAGVSDVATDVEGGATSLSFGEGKAAFTQEGGRHVEVTLRVVKVEAAVAP